MNKKINKIAIIMAAILLTSLSVILYVSDKTTDTNTVYVESIIYNMDGFYYDGYVITQDGNIWDYYPSDNDRQVTPNKPVVVIFSDNCTPDVITDDIIVMMIIGEEELK